MWLLTLLSMYIYRQGYTDILRLKVVNAIPPCAHLVPSGERRLLCSTTDPQPGSNVIVGNQFITLERWWYLK